MKNEETTKCITAENNTNNKAGNTEQPKGIVLNRMYAGQYLKHNLGHEVINFFKADDGNHYLYLNATGDFALKHKGKIGYMLLVKYFAPYAVEVVGMATGLEDMYDPAYFKEDKCGEIKVGDNLEYGGQSLSSLFQGSQQQNIYVTYKAENVYVPKKRIFIRFATDNSTQLLQTEFLLSRSEQDCSGPESVCVVTLSKLKQAKTSLKQYIYPARNETVGKEAADAKADSADEEESVDYTDYMALYDSLISNCEANGALWEKCDGSINKKSTEQSAISLFDICQIQDNENCFSNALAYFMVQPNYRKLWSNFFQERGIGLYESYWVEREFDISSADAICDTDLQNTVKNSLTGRIDILLIDKDGDNLVMIENKIKSGINSIAGKSKNTTKGKDKGEDFANQLTRYAVFCKHFIKSSASDKRTCSTFGHINKYVLAPNYNLPDIPAGLKGEYKILTYKDLYDYLNREDVRRDWCKDANFSAFVEAIRKHTYSYIGDYLRNEMESAFVRKLANVSR